MDGNDDRQALRTLARVAIALWMLAVLALQILTLAVLWHLEIKSRLIYFDEDIIEALQRMDTELMDIRDELEAMRIADGTD